MHNFFRYTTLMIFSLLTLFSCQKAESEYTTSQCYFAFNFSYHNASRLLSVVNAYETYAIVHTEPLSGKAYRVVTDIYGTDATHDDITTAEETQRTRIVGLSNGLIIGCSSLDQTLYAFDRQCPNCYQASGLTAAPLQWADNSYTVKCNKCGRQYSLTNGGVISAGEPGSRLLRYRVSTDKSTYLIIQNR